MTASVLIFSACVAFVVYVLAGYPALLWLLVRMRSRHDARKLPVSAEAPLPTVSVILPVRNGERWIRAKLRTLDDLDYPADLVRIIVVSDGSTDRTVEIVRSYSERIILVELPPGGKAVAINEALKHATGEILFMTDVRQTLNAEALRALVDCFRDKRVGVATGELIITSDTAEQEQTGLYWRYEKWIRKHQSALDSVMGATGAIYAIRRHLADPLPPGTLLDDVYLPIRAFLRNYRILFVPEARAFDKAVDLGAEFHRKVRTLAGVYQLIGMCPRLIGPSNRMWLHFMSHKVGRLVLPYALLAMFVSSWFLLWPFSALLVAVQVAFYSVAILDPFIVGPRAVKRLSSAARTFTVLMWAAFCAASILVRPSDAFWRPATHKSPAQG